MEPSNVIETDSMQKKRVVTLPPILDRAWVASSTLSTQKNPGNLILDFSATTRVDSAGLCFIRLLHTTTEQKRGSLILRNITPEILSTLETWGHNAPPVQAKSDTKPKSITLTLGEFAFQCKETVIQALSVLVDMLYWGTFGALKRHDFKKGGLGEQMFMLGYKAFGIIALLSFLIGLVLALQTAIQLDSFGAGVFLGPLIGKTMAREMGPLLTAIILAGRTGSATTAEIATMVVGEELDALQVMGINPMQYVVIPKFWAITITMPVLTVLATLAGILGGYMVSTFYLGLASSLYWGQLTQFITITDFVASFTKSVVFAWLIIWIGTFYGLRVKGGAEAVGRETTASVVTGIFVIIIADAIFSFII